jgi:saccharopine dehydrogenase (NAD+, L-lysine-forming)
MELFRDYQAQVFKHGEWTQAGSRGLEIRTVDFGGEIGVRRCFSLFLEELRALPEMYPALRDVGFYVSETHWLLDWVITPLVLAGLKIAPRRGVRPLGRLLWWGMRTLPRPPHRVLLKVEGRGEKANRPARVELTVSHRDGYELTAIPVVACLLQYLDGSVRRPGLWMMGHLVEPVRLFRDMERMGAEVSSVTV